MTALLPFGSTKKKDPMRQSTAMTTVILLQQNQKFERFMRQKIDELETRVSAQQARISSREQQEEQEIWADMEELDGLVDEVAGSDEVAESFDDQPPDEVAVSDEAGHPAAGADFAIDQLSEGGVEGGKPDLAAEEDTGSDYVSLMMGTETGAQDPETDESPADLPALAGAVDVASGESEENDFLGVLSMDRFTVVEPETDPAAEGAAIENEEPTPATGEEIPEPDYVSLAMGLAAGVQPVETDESLASPPAPPAGGEPAEADTEGGDDAGVQPVETDESLVSPPAPPADGEPAEETTEGDVQQELLAQWDSTLAEEDDSYRDGLS